MMTVWRKEWVFKFDGKLGTIENTKMRNMYFLSESETKLAVKSNKELDKLINLIILGESLNF